jgi:hypothetical protein
VAEANGREQRSRVARFPTAVRFQRQRGFTTTALLKTVDLRPKEQGQPKTLEYRMFLEDDGYRKVSLWTGSSVKMEVSRCKTPDFHRKSESLYHRDSPWISGYRAQNVSQINTQSHTSHHIKYSTQIYYKSIMEYIITRLLAESE